MKNTPCVSQCLKGSDYVESITDDVRDTEVITALPYGQDVILAASKFRLAAALGVDSDDEV